MLKKINLNTIQRQINPISLGNIVVLICLVLLPYWLFEGDYFIGGDDSRLYFLYPDLWIKNVSFYSWFTASNIGLHNPQQFTLPLLAFSYCLHLIFPPIIAFNLAISAPFVIGFIFFQKMILALDLDKCPANTQAAGSFLGALIYIFSPVLWGVIVPGFLYCIWLLPLVPILIFYFIRFYFTNKFKYVLFANLWSVVFSIAFIAVPWIVGLLIPIFAGVFAGLFLFSSKDIYKLLKYAFILSITIIFSQLFWLLPFVSTLLDASWSITASALSPTVRDSFSPTVIATMFNNNPLYPILNLFHRSIAFDFDWRVLREAFFLYYDKILLINIFFIVLIVGGSISVSRINNVSFRKIYFSTFFAWVLAIFLFTVNIGQLRDLFLLFRFIPGSGMLRNPFDKFSIGYVFIYSVLMSFSYIAIGSQNIFPNKRIMISLTSIFIIIVGLNCMPLKKLVNRTLKGAENYTTVTRFPEEYLSFIKEIEKKVLFNNKILNIPFAFPAYAVVPADSIKKVYAGASPLILFGGQIDLPGFLAFPLDSQERQRLYSAVMNEDVGDFELILTSFNIGYFLFTKNISDQLNNSILFNNYLQQTIFNKKLEEILNKHFLGKKLLVSSKGNYVLYQNSLPMATFEGKNLVFQKISPVKYYVDIKNGVETNTSEITFKQSFNFGWKMYPRDKEEFTNCSKVLLKAGTSEECRKKMQIFSFSDLKFILQNSIPFKHFTDSQGLNNVYEIDKNRIKDFILKGSNESDGSIYLTLYFYPQVYFYLGSMISLIAIFGLFGLSYLPIKRKEKA